QTEATAAAAGADAEQARLEAERLERRAEELKHEAHETKQHADQHLTKADEIDPDVTGDQRDDVAARNQDEVSDDRRAYKHGGPESDLTDREAGRTLPPEDEPGSRRI